MNSNGNNNPHHLTLPPSQASLVPFPPGCPCLVYVPSAACTEVSAPVVAAASSPSLLATAAGGYIARVDSIYIDLGSTSRDNYYRVRPLASLHVASLLDDASSMTVQLPSVPQSALRYAPQCPVAVAVASLPLPGGGGSSVSTSAPPGQNGTSAPASKSTASTERIPARVMSCCDIPSDDGTAIETYYMLDIPEPRRMQATVPASALRYCPPPPPSSEQTSHSHSNSAEAVAKEKEKAEDDDEEEVDEEVAVANNANNGNETKARQEVQEEGHHRQEDANVPVAGADAAAAHAAAAAVAVAAGEMEHDATVPVHVVPIDEDASLNSSSIQGPPSSSPKASSTGRQLPPAEEEDGKLPAQRNDDESASTGVIMSPKPPVGAAGSKRPHPTDAAAESPEAEVVRRIDIPDALDANKIRATLVGPDHKVNQRMQTKFQVLISILGLDDILGVPPDGAISIESFSKLGPISFKAGDKCIMIRGAERKVHDASKVVIHMLVNKCYVGDDKDGLMRELRTIRQIRKKPGMSPAKSKSPRDDSVSVAPAFAGLSSPMEERPTKRPATEASIQAVRKDADHSDEPIPQRGWSPAQGKDEIFSEQDRKPAPNLPSGQVGAFSVLHTEAPPENFDDHSRLFGEPTFRNGIWSVQVRSLLDRRLVFFSFIGSQYKVRDRLKEKFHLSHVEVIKGTPFDSVLIEGDTKERVKDAANYIAFTINEMAKPAKVQSEAETTLSTSCSWDGECWWMDIISPVSRDLTFHVVYGQNTSSKHWLRNELRCYKLHPRGGDEERNESHRHLPLHIHIADGSRMVVEDAGEHITKLLNDVKTKQDSLSRVSHRIPSNDHMAHPMPHEAPRGTPFSHRSLGVEPAVQNQNGPRGLVIAGPRLEGNNWEVKVRSPIGKNTLVANIFRGEAKTAMECRFGLSSFVFVESKEEMPLHVVIRSPEKSSALAAADYLADTLHEMSKPFVEEPEWCFDTCYWNGRTKWILNFRLPCAEKPIADAVIGPGGRRNAELRAKLSCAVCLDGGPKEKIARLRQYPKHLSIRDGSRILVEAAGNYMFKMMQDIASKCNPSTNAGPPRLPESRHHSAGFQHQHEHPHPQQHAHQHPHQVHNFNTQNPRRPVPAEPAGSAANPYWTTTVWPPIEQYPSCDFCNRIVGPQGTTQRALEHRFGVEIKIWGHQGNQREPLHFVVNGRASRDVDAAANHIADILIPAPYPANAGGGRW